MVGGIECLQEGKSGVRGFQDCPPVDGGNRNINEGDGHRWVDARGRAGASGWHAGVVVVEEAEVFIFSYSRFYSAYMFSISLPDLQIHAFLFHRKTLSPLNI